MINFNVLCRALDEHKNPAPEVTIAENKNDNVHEDASEIPTDTDRTEIGELETETPVQDADPSIEIDTVQTKA